MNHSLSWTVQKQQYSEQLQVVDELRSKQLDKYMQLQSNEYKKMEHLLERYMQYVQSLLSLSEPPKEQLAMINSIIEIEYLDDGFVDTYCIVLPDEIDPESGKISILSPVGSQLLLVPLHETISLSTPAGIIEVRVNQISERIA